MAPANDVQNSNQDTQARIKQQSQRTYHFKAGTIIHTNKGTFEILAPLGQGGFADVYHCSETDIGRDFAIKVLIKKGANLKDEAKIVAKLKHTNIIQIHAFAELNEDKTPIIIYDYIKGLTLYELMGKGKLSLDMDTLAIIQQIGDALAFAHKKGIHHRDIKPSNIIIDTNGKAYLTDFGLASVKSAPEGGSLFTDEVRLRLGGTIPYMPPELLQNESLPANVKTDIYSLGIVVYEMLTGQLPYPGRDVQLMTNIISEKVPPTSASHINPNLPPGLDEVFEKALAFHPENRYQTVNDFIAALEPVAKTYAEKATRYQQAIEHIENGRWLEAKTLLQQLPKEHEDVAIQLVQVKQKLALQKLIRDTEDQIKNEEYSKALATLETLREIDPNHKELGNLHKQALTGKAKQDQRSLAEQYKQAVTQVNQGQHQAALDTITIIKQKDPSYPDPDEVEKVASKVVQEQNELQALMNQGREYARSGEWEKARETFTELSHRKSDYQDVNQQLSSAEHFYELVSLRQQARESQKQGQYAKAIDLLDALKNKNKRYKPAEIASERQTYVLSMVAQCEEAIINERFDAALTTVAQLKERQPDQPGLDKLEKQAQEGLHRQEITNELKTEYAQAEEKIQRLEYLLALEQWQSIQQKATENNIYFADSHNIENQSKQGIYREALTALTNQLPQKALEIWDQIIQFDPDYVDVSEIVTKANTQIQADIEQKTQEIVEQEKRNRRNRYLIWGIAVIVSVVIIGILIANAINADGNATPTTDTTATQTAAAIAALTTNTHTPSPTATAHVTFTPTPTTTPTSSPTSTATAMPSPTSTSTPSPEPANIATARFSSSIFSEPDETSTELTFVDPGESVTVLEEQGSWIRVINDTDIEGWAAANRFDITIGNPTETAPPSNINTPTLTPDAQIATITQSASLFAGLGTDEITFINPNTIVTVLGRSSNNSWLYIRTPSSQEGWVAVSHLSYVGNISDLPIQSVTSTPDATRPTNTPTGPVSNLTFDFWDLPGAATCNGGNWTMPLFMEGHGGDDRYTYYINGQRVAGPLSGSYTYNYDGSGDSNVRITGRVTSGDGQNAETILFAGAPDC